MSLHKAALLALVLAPITMSMALNSTNDESGFHFHEDEGHHEERNELGLWLASTTAIIIISLCGIFGVLVIPIMQKVFYQHLIQFLVALAIGTLCGDALLHLYPHALLGMISHKKSLITIFGHKP